MKEILYSLEMLIRQAFVFRKELLITNTRGCSTSVALSNNNAENGEFSIRPHNFYTGHCFSGPQKGPCSRACIIPPEVQEIRFHTRVLYIFLFDAANTPGTVFRRHKSVFENTAGLAVLVDKASMQLVFNNTRLDKPSGPITFVAGDRTMLHTHALFSVLLAVTLAITYVLCRVVIARYEYRDPHLEDFVIKATDLLLYKDVLDKTIKNCTICFEDFKMNDRVRELCCAHIFHPDCVDTWLIGHSNCCPYCREEIEVTERV